MNSRIPVCQFSHRKHKTGRLVRQIASSAIAAGPWPRTDRHHLLLSPSLLSILGFLSNSNSNSASISGVPGGVIQT